MLSDPVSLAASNWQDARWRSRLRSRLLDWYRQNARDLPWRRDPDPYRVWISEIMCQQTQVATVVPYFQRFMRRFPTVAELADAEEEELLRHWEGLGYYRRARSLHAAAKTIVSNGGDFPREFDDVIALPGIGRYTAGAILSIAFDQRQPILEGNTQRVFSRWIALPADPTSPSANQLLWRVAAAILPRQGAGEFNQAAMELGAMVCTPKNPDCQRCPVKGYCAARQTGLELDIPHKKKSIEYQDRTEYALVIRDSAGKYLLRPLPDAGRWAGLWDFPRTSHVDATSIDSAADWLARELGVAVKPGVRLQTIKHAVTKYRISLHVHEAGWTTASAELPVPWRFVEPGELRRLPMSVTGRTIAEHLANESQPRLPL